LLSHPIYALLIKFSQERFEHRHMICDNIVAKLHALVPAVDDADLGSYAALGFNVPLNACRLILLFRNFIIYFFELSPSDQIRFA